MDISQIESKIKQALPDAEIMLSGDGCNCEAVVISNAFAGKPLLHRQRLVMEPVAGFIKSGELHALSVKAYTKDEWSEKN